MSDELMTAIAAGLAAILGALLSGLASVYASNKKIREIEISLQNKIRENYLENARKLSAEIYIPLAVALSKLSLSFRRMRSMSSPENMNSENAFKTDFEDECLRFIGLVDDLSQRSADAYLTIELDTELERFHGFLSDSLDAAAVKRKLVVTPIFASSFLGLNMGNLHVTTSRKAFLPWPRAVSFVTGGVGFQYNEQILSAPVTSTEFESMFEPSVIVLKNLIKEVTLGAPRGMA